MRKNEYMTTQIVTTTPGSTTRTTHCRRKYPRKLFFFGKFTYPASSSKYFIHKRRSETPLRDKIPPYRSNRESCYRSCFFRYVRQEGEKGKTSPSPRELQEENIDEIVLSRKVRLGWMIRENSQQHRDRIEC